MKKQITHFSIHQSSKVISLLYFLPLAIILIPLGVVFLFMGDNSSAFSCFAFPLLYMIFTYLVFALILWIYNRVAEYFGGIEYTTQIVEKDENGST